jgi:branched-chain amino acid aminotransferase
MGLKVYINGEFVEKEEAKISVFDHGLLYGDGVFEGIRVYGGKAFKLDEHVARLYESAGYISLPIPLDPDDMKKAISGAVETNGLDEAYIRVVVTRGSGTLGLDPDKCTNPCVIIIVDHIAIYPEELYEKGMEIVTAATRRNIPEAVNVRVKSLNYLNNILAKIEGKNAGCVEALMLNQEGFVAECTGDNIFIVSDGVLKTPPESAGILKGVTRQIVMGLAEKEGIPLEEVDMTRYDVIAADECFLTGTAAEIIAVVKLDGRPIGDGKPGEITRRLRALFKEML